MRNLLNRSYEVLGVDQKIWISSEVGGYGENATGGLVPVDAGAVEHVNCGINFDIPREDSTARSGRSVAVRLSGKKTVEVTAESYIIPGTPDGLGHPTLPPMHPLIVSAFGAVDLADPTKVVYKLSRLNDKSFRVLEEATHYSRLAIGCVADKLTFTLPGDGKAMMKFEGFGQDVFAAGSSKLARAATGVAQAASKIVQDLTYTAVAAGQAGNGISVRYVDGVALSVAVVGLAITVTLETGVSDADAVKSAVDGTPAAAALVSTAVTGNGATVQTAFTPAVNLVGGLGESDVEVEDGEGQKFEINSLIDIVSGVDGNTISSTAKKITAINGDILTLATAPAAAIVGDLVVGHAPENYAPLSSENALLGLKGSLSFAGVPISNCEVLSAEIALANNFTKKDMNYGTSKICGYIPDKRRAITLKLELLLNKSNFTQYMRTKQFIAEDVKLTIEPQDIPAPAFLTSVGRTFEFSMPKVEFKIPNLEQPADGYVKLSLEGTVMASSLNSLDDELTLTIK